MKADGFKNNFINLLILGQSLNAFDFLVIDMMWWRNSKRVRFTNTKKGIVFQSEETLCFIFERDCSLFDYNKKPSARALDYENAPHSQRVIQAVAISYTIKNQEIIF